MKAFKYAFPAGSYRLKEGEDVHYEVAREVAPGLIVTGSKGSYRITHKLSGLLTSSHYYPTLKQATEKAQLMAAALASWDIPKEELEKAMHDMGKDKIAELKRAVAVEY